MSVVKVIELVGASDRGWEEAVQEAVSQASRTLDNITAVEVVNTTADVDDDRIVKYKANVKIAFVVDGNRRQMA